MTKEKLYKFYDLHDKEDYSFKTLEQIRDWLRIFWVDNPDEDMTEEEHDNFIEEIECADEDELLELILNVDYYFEKV